MIWGVGARDTETAKYNFGGAGSKDLNWVDEIGTS